MTLEFCLNSVLIVGEFLNLIGWYGSTIFGIEFGDPMIELVLGGEFNRGSPLRFTKVNRLRMQLYFRYSRR